MNQINDAVKRALMSNGMTIPQLAKEIGMPNQQLYGVLGHTKRKNAPTLTTLNRVLDGAGLVLVAVPPEMAAFIEGAQNELQKGD